MEEKCTYVPDLCFLLTPLAMLFFFWATNGFKKNAGGGG
jgi:hypothetical protein